MCVHTHMHYTNHVECTFNANTQDPDNAAQTCACGEGEGAMFHIVCWCVGRVPANTNTEVNIHAIKPADIKDTFYYVHTSCLWAQAGLSVQVLQSILPHMVIILVDCWKMVQNNDRGKLGASPITTYILSCVL